jgi:hypothetical protein
MKNFLWLVFFFAVLLLEGSAKANAISCATAGTTVGRPLIVGRGRQWVGVRHRPASKTFLNVYGREQRRRTVQTYGLGGRTNVAGTVISAGGFDSLVALFSGTPTSASILTSGGNSSPPIQLPRSSFRAAAQPGR